VRKRIKVAAKKYPAFHETASPWLGPGFCTGAISSRSASSCVGAGLEKTLTVVFRFALTFFAGTDLLLVGNDSAGAGLALGLALALGAGVGFSGFS
jgi:hypothetical protein